MWDNGSKVLFEYCILTFNNNGILTDSPSKYIYMYILAYSPSTIIAYSPSKSIMR